MLKGGRVRGTHPTFGGSEFLLFPLSIWCTYIYIHIERGEKKGREEKNKVR
jgi:hypothetical protein